MAIIKGQNLRIALDGKYVAASTSCSFHISANLEEASHKDLTGGWSSQECTGKSWDFSADALMLIDAADTTGVAALDIAELVGKTVEISVDLTQGAQNRVMNQGLYTGTAIINDFSLTAGNKQNVTYSVQGQGVGELVKVEAGE
jgi:predicted secreted protein